MDSEHVVAHLSGEAALPEPCASNRYHGPSTPTPPTAPHTTPENKPANLIRSSNSPSISSKADADFVSVSGAASSSGSSYTWLTTAPC